MKKRFVFAVVIFFVALFAFRLSMLIKKGKSSGQFENQRPAVAVKIVPVRFGPIKGIRKFTGAVFPYNQYIVAPKISGRIIQITCAAKKEWTL